MGAEVQAIAQQKKLEQQQMQQMQQQAAAAAQLQAQQQQQQQQQQSQMQQGQMQNGGQAPSWLDPRNSYLRSRFAYEDAVAPAIPPPGSVSEELFQRNLKGLRTQPVGFLARGQQPMPMQQQQRGGQPPQGQPPQGGGVDFYCR